MKRYITLIFATALLSACGSESPNPGANTGGENAVTTKTIKINGKTPIDYYNQFLHKTSGKCDEGGLWFHFLGTYNSYVVGQTEDERDIRAEMDIYMMKDGTYVSDYIEMTVIEYTDDGFTWKDDEAVVHVDKGTWKVVEDKLVLSELGVGSAIRYNDKDKVALKFEGQNARKFAGRDEIMSFVVSSASYKPYTEYCPE